MKKYITYTLLCLSFSHLAHAQDNANPDMNQLSSVYNSIDGSFYGKNFLFETKWVRAKLLLADNTVLKNDSLLYNFDKIGFRLLVTRDFKRVFEIDRREFKAILFYDRDTGYIFKHINFINDKDLFEVLVNESSKYSLYKVVRTKLVRGSFSSASYFLPNARPMDIYQNAAEYYIFFPNREYQTIHMIKKSSIERAFKLNPDSDKVASFLSMRGNKEYDEKDLVQLILYLNKGSF